MVGDLNIRHARPDEAPELAAIGYVAWEHAILPLQRESRALRQHEQRRLAHYTAECLGRIIVAEHRGDLAGWCSRARGRPYIPYLFVAPYMQGQGVGSALLQRMESILELYSYDRVHLETPADHVLAVRFYERQGYRILAIKPSGDGQHEPLNSVRLEKRLTPYRGEIGDV